MLTDKAPTSYGAMILYDTRRDIDALDDKDTCLHAFGCQGYRDIEVGTSRPCTITQSFFHHDVS